MLNNLDFSPIFIAIGGAINGACLTSNTGINILSYYPVFYLLDIESYQTLLMSFLSVTDQEIIELSISTDEASVFVMTEYIIA